MSKTKTKSKDGLKYISIRLLPNEIKATIKYAKDTNRTRPGALQELIKEALRLKGYLPKTEPEVMIEEA